mmetsp:Transcript_7959/g.21324  ORF Transcript_7959/g.21324 Transcript_7959/m.21324 type:complete len:388 (+) Transcript_7959:829-1992(+)
MLDVARLQQVAGAVGAIERAPVGARDELRVPLVLVHGLPVASLADVALLQGEAEAAQRQVRAGEHELRPRARPAAEVQECGTPRHPLHEPDGRGELREFVPGAVFVLLAALAGVREELRAGDAAHEATGQGRRGDVPEIVQAALGLPERLHLGLAAEGALQDALLHGAVHLRALVQLEGQRCADGEAHAGLRERGDHVEAHRERVDAQGVEVGLQPLVGDGDPRLHAVAPGDEEAQLLLGLTVLVLALALVALDLDADAVHDRDAHLHADLDRGPVADQHHCAALPALPHRDDRRQARGLGRSLGRKLRGLGQDRERGGHHEGVGRELRRAVLLAAAQGRRPRVEHAPQGVGGGGRGRRPGPAVSELGKEDVDRAALLHLRELHRDL